LGHSRGTIVQNNAFNILADKGHVNEKLEVLGVGGAVDVGEYTSSAAQVNQQPRKVEYVYMRNDPVSVIAAGNSGDAMAAFKEFWNVLQSDNSAHSCYGTGAAGCKTIANPVIGGPMPKQQQSSNVMTYRGGKLVLPEERKP
jgi:filamentous hemagglutinin